MKAQPLDKLITEAAEKLSAGDIVAIPTETVYGLAASIGSEAGLRKVFELKSRPFFDPLIVHVASFRQARQVVREWPPLADYLARVFWPGPLTLVLPKAASINPLITSGLDTVAVRHPRHALACRLIEVAGPLAAPSANKFGHTSPSRAEHVRSEFPGEDLLVLDGGPSEVGLESTVIAFALDQTDEAGRNFDEIRVLRHGGVTNEALSDALSRFSRPARLRDVASESERVRQSPGTLKHHYMPKIPLLITNRSFPKADGDGRIDLGARLDREEAQRLTEKLGTLPRVAAELVLHEKPEQAARELYSEMRRLAESGADAILVRRKPSQSGGTWTAIWDRLGRAATFEFS